MLKDEDRIFKNLYNDLGWDIESAVTRGDWLHTKEIISKIAESLSNKVSLENSDWEIIVQVLRNKTGVSIIRPNTILSVSKEKRIELD